MIEFFDTDTSSGTASIYESHVTFNKSLLQYFVDAYKVRVGIDGEGRKLYVFMINKDYALSGEIPETSLLSISTSKTYARICSRAMVEYICKTFKLKIGKNEFLRYTAEYDDSKKAIIINMGGQIK